MPYMNHAIKHIDTPRLLIEGGGEVWVGVVGGGGALWWEGGVLSLGTSKLACTRLI